MGMNNPRLLEANGSIFTAQFADGEQLEIPNITSYQENEGTTPSTQKPTFTGVAVIIGRQQPSSLTINVEALPHLDVFQKIDEAHKNGDVVQLKFHTAEDKRYTADSDKVAIATDGAVTITGTGPDLTGTNYSIGDAYKIGNKYYVINSISSAGVATIQDPPSTAVAAATYTIVTPPIGREYFAVKITAYGSISMTADDAAMQTIQAQMIGVPPAAKVIV